MTITKDLKDSIDKITFIYPELNENADFLFIIETAQQLALEKEGE